MISFITPPTRNELVEDNLGLAHFVAHDMRHNGYVRSLGHDEAVSFCLLALTQLADGHDPLRRDFASYAAPLLRKRLGAYAKAWSRDGGCALGEEYDTPETEPLDTVDDEVIAMLLTELSARRQFVITRYFGIGTPRQSVVDIAESLAVSHATVQRILRRSLKALREAAAERNLG